MPFYCPTCGKPTQSRRPEVKNVAGGMSVGLLYLLFAPFFARQFCPEHGKLERADFPPSERRRLMIFPICWLIAAVVMLALVGWLIAGWLS